MNGRLEIINDLNVVKLPRWSELPEFGIYRDQLVTIVNGVMDNIVHTDEDSHLTVSMINNYVKWKVMPKPIKKKYFKNHIAFCIVITCLKPILTISNINKGIQLQTKIDGEEKAYDRFCSILESIFNKELETFNDLDYNEELNISSENLGIYTSCNALYYKKLSDLILSSLSLDDSSSGSTEHQKEPNRIM